MWGWREKKRKNLETLISYYNLKKHIAFWPQFLTPIKTYTLMNCKIQLRKQCLKCGILPGITSDNSMAHGLPWADDDYALNQQYSLSLHVLKVKKKSLMPHAHVLAPKPVL